MLKINIICVGKVKEKYLKDAIDEYSKRLSKYCNLDIIELEDEKLPSNINLSQKEAIKKKESERILEKIQKDTYVFVLDLKGKQYTSEEFAQKINTITINENSNITFIIGGTLGLTQEILQRADNTICFSKMKRFYYCIKNL